MASISKAKALATHQEPALVALQDLVDGLLCSDDILAGAASIDPKEIPEPCHDLLVHGDHMTTRLEAFHGRPVELNVLREEQRGEFYQREIVLNAGESGPIVEYGVVRMNLERMGPAVRAEIINRRRPLGDILIRHNVLRRVEARWFLRFQEPSRVLGFFEPMKYAEAYGRIGMIHCDGEPAIELLEVVPDMRAMSG